MKSSKSKTSNSLTAEKLQQIIKNVRNASRIINAPGDSDDERECHRKFSHDDGSTRNASQLKISHRKLTADEIDKLMKNLATAQRPLDEPGCLAASAGSAGEKQQVELEAVELSVLEDQYAESEISFTSYRLSTGSHSERELSADVEDNLAYSRESLRSFNDNVDNQSDRSHVELNFSPAPATPVPLFAFRPIEQTASEEYESYGEISRSTVDRPIMQVKVRPLPASHSIRTKCLRKPPSDDELPSLIDFRQIERNTMAAWKLRVNGKSCNHHHHQR
ncbi:uncharacterized protein LOC128299598 [Anopheles moucheti]|uniref:uncharacterized protein LOC128299598 n=1 Tax=Anopheles moucheti TaxID=186751 RepID=UPI0022F0CB33|nr:uncharacterized protein LOC128299598 [Anopheles moucheti]